MDKYVSIIVIISLLWHTCLSTTECNRTISGTVMTFQCPSSVVSEELTLYDLTTTQLDNITSFIALGPGGTASGPFTSIPANICLLRNLQSVTFSNNRIITVDPTGSLTCLSNMITLDLNTNFIGQFPSFMIYNMPNLKTLNFQSNKLIEVPSNAFVNVSSLDTIIFSNNQLTSFELWALEVSTTADFSNNQISTITNKYFFQTFLDKTRDFTPTVLLNNNAATIDFTDAIYEMYGQCQEVYDWYFSSDENPNFPVFTFKVAHMNFGSSKIRCSCDQAYFLTLYENLWNLGDLPIKQVLCTNTSLSANDITFVNSSCVTSLFAQGSTVNFTQVSPRLCKINDAEPGVTINTTASPPTSTAPTYPYSITVQMVPGACFLTFLNTTSMTITCTVDISNTVSRFPNSLLSNTYMSTITRVSYTYSLSSLPTYLCSLPSRQIDLSYQSFSILSDATFPCLDSFQTVKLSNNNLTTVNMSSGNFQTLNSLDLSSNLLTQIPYSILNPTPTSLRLLDLRNNSINYIDLFIYTRKNITIRLDNNPINSSNIINPQNVTLTDTTNSTASVTLPSSVTNSTYIIDDSIALTYGICNSFQALRTTLQDLKLIYTTVYVSCTCAAINLRQIYQQNGLNVTNDFSCSVGTNQTTFYSLSTNCTGAANFQSGLCTNTTTTQSPSITSAPPGPSSGSGSGSSSSHTGLIVGLTVGIIGGLGLIAGGIGTYFFVKSRAAAAGAKKPAGRSTASNSLQSRVQPRNLRAVKLAPIASSSNPLPTVPVAKALPAANGSKLPFNNTNYSTSAKGIPVKIEPIRTPSNVNPTFPPDSNALTNSTSFRPIDKSVSKHQIQLPQQQSQPSKPPPKQTLNIGGDTRYS